ncbi:tyrosine-type recombinase/integrase [Amorphus orientalis]|uniref:Integrase n=1 Tax=Amorphus orientalis TaxID=649198 RepID=A0AAE3VTT0_9HYPH|nr:integrase arm-type DNA-binding domain-containing protein [Amorphus orientalis]MDQ0317710.1 integrase [Amorphus orientalis]
MALTDVAIRNMSPGDRDYKVTDKDGLYLLVRKNGSKLWRMNYTFDRKQKTASFGKYPSVSLAEARSKCAQARRDLADGFDPIARKQRAAEQTKLAEGNLFEAVAEEYLESLKHRGRTTDTIRLQQWVLMDVIGPKILKRPVSEIRAAEVLEVLRKIESSGRIETAHRARHAMSAVFRLAITTDRAERNPADAVKGLLKTRKAKHHPAIVDIAPLRTLLKTIDDYRGHPTMRLTTLFLAYTFTRPGEVRLSTWDEIDYEDDVWRIHPERMKMRRPHEVPLTSSTRKILRDARALRAHSEGYIFPSIRSSSKPIARGSLSRMMGLIGYRGQMTPHGFRSTASSILNERGYRKEAIELQLAHEEEDEVRRAYNRARYWDERVEMMRDWARILDDLRTG